VRRRQRIYGKCLNYRQSPQRSYLAEIGANGYRQLRLRSLKVSVHSGAVPRVVHYNNGENRCLIVAIYCNLLFSMGCKYGMQCALFITWFNQDTMSYWVMYQMPTIDGETDWTSSPSFYLLRLRSRNRLAANHVIKQLDRNSQSPDR
jgi:hypothetical protein